MAAIAAAFDAGLVVARITSNAPIWAIVVATVVLIVSLYFVFAPVWGGWPFRHGAGEVGGATVGGVAGPTPREWARQFADELQDNERRTRLDHPALVNPGSVIQEMMERVKDGLTPLEREARKRYSAQLRGRGLALIDDLIRAGVATHADRTRVERADRAEDAAVVFTRIADN
ncbi:MAG: hypothetical protein ABSG64_13940 [Solirubrobacteraceae bacterium]|jgi:hypothetical protein